jgi:SWI/SNF-related matrix-associated actin-dependent regulator of chromatin subfamily A-like protein 1
MPRMTALPHQLAGADFLASRRTALLADHPRVGKTGAAILAADDILAARILVITTASGRPVWVRGFRDWSAFDLPTRAVYGELGSLDGDLRLIVSWSEIGKHAEALGKVQWDVLILDESHYAKSPDTKRTQAVYGTFRGASRGWGVCDAAARVWCLTGTPIPNAPNDLYPMLRALDGTRIEDVLKYEDFLHRYCIVKKKAISRYTKIDVVIGGRNLEELKARLDGFWLRRTQADVGIRPPTFEMLPLHLTASERKAVELAVPEGADILAAAETGETKSLDIQLGTLRRLTGQIKAQKVAEVVAEEFEGGLDKIVLFCWHKDVMDALERALEKYGVVRVDGGTSPTERDKAVQSFQSVEGSRVFIGQIIAAGEAIDLSAAAELIFVESSFVPKDMKQAALRVTNHGQTRQTRVRVAALEGSIDEALQAIVIRKVQVNKEIMQ